jgi:hypothetical protein
MTLTLTPNTSLAAKLALWTAENPAAARLVLFALPLALAAAGAAITHHPLFFLPPTGGGTGGCGGC